MASPLFHEPIQGQASAFTALSLLQDSPPPSCFSDFHHLDMFEYAGCLQQERYRSDWVNFPHCPVTYHQLSSLQQFTLTASHFLWVRTLGTVRLHPG